MNMMVRLQISAHHMACLKDSTVKNKLINKKVANVDKVRSYFNILYAAAQPKYFFSSVHRLEMSLDDITL